MLNIFRKNKVAELTNEEKVAQSRERVQSALSMFSTIHQDLSEANVTLNDVIREDKAQVEKLNKNIVNAISEMESNIKLQEQIRPFIKGEKK